MKRSRYLYIIEAALEYLVSILVAGSFLATLTRELGMSDSLTGILSSVISLGCLFQLFSTMFRKKVVKRFVLVLSVLNQLLFMLLYIVPTVPLSPTVKIAAFIVFIVLAYLLYYIAHPKKVAWLMGLVEDGQRGSFTANKEIISLLLGIIFSYGMGALFDHFTAKGDSRTALILGAITIFVLILLHTATMLFTVERQDEQTASSDVKQASLRESLISLIHNKRIFGVIVISVLYNIAHYVAMPFYGTYQIGELGFSLTLVSVLGILSSVARILVSQLWGKYADRKSFAAMIEKCFLILGLGYLCIVFAVPSNGIVMFSLYYICNGIAMGGVNSALTNLVFDYVPHENRADSLAICQAIAGVIGFLSTLIVSPLVSYIQSTGNTLFGIPIYAQQIVSLISVLFTAAAILYVRFAILNKSTESR